VQQHCAGTWCNSVFGIVLERGPVTNLANENTHSEGWNLESEKWALSLYVVFNFCLDQVIELGQNQGENDDKL